MMREVINILCNVYICISKAKVPIYIFQTGVLLELMSKTFNELFLRVPNKQIILTTHFGNGKRYQAFCKCFHITDYQ